MDSLMGSDLDQLAQVIAGALHEERPDVGKKPGPDPVVPAGGKNGGGNQNQDLKSNRVQDPTRKDSERMKEKGLFEDQPSVSAQSDLYL